MNHEYSFSHCKPLNERATVHLYPALFLCTCSQVIKRGWWIFCAVNYFYFRYIIIFIRSKLSIYSIRQIPSLIYVGVIPSRRHPSYNSWAGCRERWVRECWRRGRPCARPTPLATPCTSRSNTSPSWRRAFRYTHTHTHTHLYTKKHARMCFFYYPSELNLPVKLVTPLVNKIFCSKKIKEIIFSI